MRKIESSANADRATRLSSRAEARSRPNGFSTMMRASSARPGGAKPFDDRGEQRGRDGEVMRRAPGAAERLLQRLERAGSR